MSSIVESQASAPDVRAGVPTRRSSLARKRAIEGYLCILPWLIGFICFTLGPMIGALVLSFADYDIITPPRFTGLANLSRVLNDPLLYRSLGNTAYISLLAVPLQQSLALTLAMALNQKLRGIAFYRTVFYLPSQMPLVAAALLWLWVLNPDFGLANALLDKLGIPPLKWLFDVNLVKPSIVMITLWGGIGTPMIVFLAGLQGVPESLYEAASIDGAGAWQRFRNVTVPMISPVIFFNLIIGVIASFQAYFTLVYTTTQGGPANASLIYIIYLFFKAFKDFEMGYASALAWLLFLVVLALTAIQFYFARRWVHYEGGERT
jgi:multiple sugar transport system permease protein